MRLPDWTMKLIVGLGNPGSEYEGTRHNVGFDVADLLVSRYDGQFKKPWLSPGHTSAIQIGQKDATVLKPTTFMNDSGRAVAPLAKKKKIGCEDILVIIDDVDLDCGELRVRKKGGAGGHNGLKSVIQHLGTQDFPRVRVGVGPRPNGENLVNFVLGRWPRGQRQIVEDLTQRSADAVAYFVQHGVDATMNQFN